jgi:DNA-binding response OmpR family regulator
MADPRAQLEDRRPLDDMIGRVSTSPALGHVRDTSSVMTDQRRDAAPPRIGLELRVDDSLVRSSDLHELLSRVHAVLRQLDAGLVTPTGDSERRHFRFAGWHLDSTTRRLTDPAGNPVPLTKGEYILLVVFLDASQRPLTREYLLQATHLHESVSDRSIDVQVLRLRRKLEPGPSAPRIIRTERGVGYRFAVPVERA